MIEIVIALYVIPLLVGWILDRLIGDPQWLPHPVVLFGQVIGLSEKGLNKGEHKKAKGAITALLLICSTAILAYLLIHYANKVNPFLSIALRAIFVFYCLAGTTLIREVVEVFKAVEISLEQGRKQVARIVGRDTSALSAQEIRTAALETLAENLSDGVIAPLFWYMVAGVPGMLTYKMINTLDSMIGYKSPRYKEFGMVAAKIDDFANYIPARLTALLMALVYRKRELPALRSNKRSKRELIAFISRYGRCHASPNSGYPEAALAAILDCRFGGAHHYFGEIVEKPYIGSNEREFNNTDVEIAVKINRRAEILTVALTAIIGAGARIFIYLCI